MSNDKLKPCPFCGGDDFDIIGHHDREECAVWCETCGAFGRGSSSKEDAIRIWNTRTPDTRIEEALKAIGDPFERYDTMPHGATLWASRQIDYLNKIKSILEGTQ